MPDALPLTGLFGKVPAHGDFVRRGLPTSFVGPWDSWLQEGMATARERLGARWAEAWDGAPPWRFALPAGACGPDAVAGVLLPSEDMVGRRFPITLAALLPPNEPMPAPAWFAALEAAALAGRAGHGDADALAAAIPLPGAEPAEVAPMAWTLVEAVDPPPPPPGDGPGILAAAPPVAPAAADPEPDLLGIFSATPFSATPPLGAASPPDWPVPVAVEVADILGGASPLPSMATPPAPEPGPADGTLAFLLGEAAAPGGDTPVARQDDFPLLPGGASDGAAGTMDEADPLAALIAAGEAPLAPRDLPPVLPAAAPPGEAMPAEFDLPPVAGPAPLLPPPAEPPTPPAGGGWWTAGGGRLPPSILSLPALLPVADFASLLEADA